MWFKRVLRDGLGLFLGIILLSGGNTVARDDQPHPSPVDLLAGKLAEQLAASGFKSVVIFDLTGPEGQWLPFGGWLADQFSTALARTAKDTPVIDRAKLSAQMDSMYLIPKAVVTRAARVSLAEALGAEGFIEGSFGPFKDQVGLTFVAWRTADVKLKNPVGAIFLVNGKVPLDAETASHLSLPLESLRPGDGIFKAGHAGMTIPTCETFPAPQFPAAAIWKLKRGVVTLMIVVSPEGQASEAKVTQTPDADLNDAALKAMATTRFKPAIDPDGDPVAVRMPFFLSFQVK
jgi:TonB family protein